MADVELDVSSSTEANTDIAGDNTEASINIIMEPRKTKIIAGVRVIIKQVKGLIGQPVVE
jgi:hypothetical protein